MQFHRLELGSSTAYIALVGRLELSTVRRISKFSLIQVFVCGGMRVGLHEELVEMKVETSNMSDNDRISGTSADEDRRKFLATCGKFAAVSSPGDHYASVHIIELYSDCAFWREGQ